MSLLCKMKKVIDVTTKPSTVTVDEVEQMEQTHDPKFHVGYEPELNLIVNTRFLSSKKESQREQSVEEIIQIGGRLSVSF